jgi:hypothetical protein
MKPKPLTVYPETDLRREVERIGDEDHNRPTSHVAIIALKAFVSLYRRDPFEALKLAGEFDKQQTIR